VTRRKRVMMGLGGGGARRGGGREGDIFARCYPFAGSACLFWVQSRIIYTFLTPWPRISVSGSILLHDNPVFSNVCTPACVLTLKYCSSFKRSLRPNGCCYYLLILLHPPSLSFDISSVSKNAPLHLVPHEIGFSPCA
jgi:hypothetical protein